MFVPQLFNGPNIRIYLYSNFFIFVFENQIFGHKYSNIRYTLPALGSERFTPALLGWYSFENENQYELVKQG